MSKIFISYRREDTAGYAINLHDRLSARFGAQQIFMDIDNIEPGEDFIEVINQKVGLCEVLLALIGRNWVSCTDESGQLRLENPEDFVRVEICAALRRKICVIPVLVGGAKPPNTKEVPAELQLLCRRNAIELSDTRFRHDVDRLIEALEKALATPPVKSAPANAEAKEVEGIAVEEKRDRKAVSQGDADALSPGKVFRDKLKDSTEGPAMVVIPAGLFLMGASPNDKDRKSYEGPQHLVNFAKPFAIGRDPVTFDEYDRFCQVTGRTLPDDQGWGRSNRPVINVSWYDANAYAEWLSQYTDQHYRLPSEAEWEYAARAGTSTAYWWGDAFDKNKAHGLVGVETAAMIVKLVGRYFLNSSVEWPGVKTEQVGSFPANPWGLRDTAGNVRELTADIWHDNYEGAPCDGSAWETGGGHAERVIRGGSVDFAADTLRSAFRSACDPDTRGYSGGCLPKDSSLAFRLAREL